MVSVVKRVRLMKGTPIFFLENFIPPSISKHLTKADLSRRPLLKILKEKINLTIGRGEMYIEAVSADDDVAEILQVQLFSPLILMRVYYWFSSGEPFEIVNLFMRSEYFKYKVDLDVKGFENI
jgi:GntR family transcriptional regulator